MREIKFRAWDKNKGRMIDAEALSWLYLRLDGDKWSIRDYPNRELLLNYGSGYLMQFTGRKDKGGQEAYEGDILHLEKGFWKIVWDENDSMFWLENSEGRYYGWMNDAHDPETSIPIEQGVIIGNIYENGDLLK